MKYLNNLTERSYNFFNKTRNGIRKAGLVALMTTMLGIGSCSEREECVSSEDRLYKNTKIVFQSNRDGKGEIYIMNADGSGQKKIDK